MSDEVLLKVSGLKKHYPIRGGVFFRQIATNYAVDGVSFQIKQGETLGIVGESGCGKSTVAKTILRLHEPTAGTIEFGGVDIVKLSAAELRKLRRDMQIIFQDPMESLNARHTVGAILEEPFIIQRLGTRRERRQWVSDLLARVGLQPGAADRYPHEFSGGQRQRIGIARAIALNPKLLVCDEPVSALDVSIQSQILNLLLQLQSELGLTMLFIAHDLAVVKHVSDRIVVMYLGKIMESNDAESLYRRPAHPYTQALLKSIPEPDPDKPPRHETLKGEVPSPINPPPGCPFHTRCPYRQEICVSDVPALRPMSGSGNGEWLVACHFAEQLVQT
jgi:oligopeptide/dipeptide ABC transporter ATP-binding protein